MIGKAKARAVQKVTATGKQPTGQPKKKMVSKPKQQPTQMSITSMPNMKGDVVNIPVTTAF